MKYIILLPTYNEAENLPLMIKMLSQFDVDILIIDDNSPDGTGELAENLKKEYSQVDVLHRVQKEGLGKAYVAGFHVAIEKKYNKVITMDCDFSHDPKYLPNLMQSAKEYDLVIGSRYINKGGVSGWSFWRKLISRGGNIYARLILQSRYKDLTGGFKCYDIKTLMAINLENLYSAGYTFQIETTYRISLQGFRIKEIPIIFKDRTHGESKMTFNIALEALKLIPKIRKNNSSK